MTGALASAAIASAYGGGPSLADASMMFASLVGAAGFTLSLLAWRLFAGSPFGRAILLLAGFMLMLAVYHPLLILYPERATTVLLLESFAFALVATFGVLTAHQHYRLSRRGGAV